MVLKVWYNILCELGRTVSFVTGAATYSSSFQKICSKIQHGEKSTMHSLAPNIFYTGWRLKLIFGAKRDRDIFCTWYERYDTLFYPFISVFFPRTIEKVKYISLVWRRFDITKISPLGSNDNESHRYRMVLMVQTRNLP